MALSSSHFSSERGSVHVWSQLDIDLRQHAISVVAQMAFNVVKTHPERSQQESSDAPATQPYPAS
jgi:hypothetical protein